jgi:hypothetical protein
MFYSNHGHYLSLSITGSTTSELPIVAVSPCSIACSGPGAQRYCGMDERMSRKTTVSLFRVRCYGTVVYIPRRVCLKPNRSRACPSSAWPKGHTIFIFFCTSPYVLTSWMTCTHTKSPTNDISKMIMITQERRVERERGEVCIS